MDKLKQHEIELNYDQIKKRVRQGDKIQLKLFRAILSITPPEVIIKELKRLKLIKYELVDKDTFAYVEVRKNK